MAITSFAADTLLSTYERGRGIAEQDSPNPQAPKRMSRERRRRFLDKYENLILAADPRVRLHERALPHQKHETAIQEKGLALVGLDQNKGQQAVHLTLVNTMDTDPDKKFMAHKPCESHHDATTRCGRGRRAEDLKFFQTHTGCVICFDTIQKDYIKEVIHNRGRTDTNAKIGGAVAHIPSTRSQVGNP